MNQEIERQFLVEHLPEISSPIRDERWYLFAEDGIELKIQGRNGEFELERMTKIQEQVRTQEKIKITPKEFEILKKQALGPIIRDSYLVSRDPQITVKVYREKFDGLVRAEVEFKRIEEAASFEPLPWFGKEITNSPLGSEAQLLRLSQKEFEELLTRARK